MTIDQLKAMFPGLPEEQYQALLNSYVAPNPDAAGDAQTDAMKIEPAKTTPAASSAAAAPTASRAASYAELAEAIGTDTQAARDSIVEAQAGGLTLVAAVKAHAAKLNTQLAEARKIQALPGGRQTPVSGANAAAGSAATGSSATSAWAAQFSAIPAKDRFMAMARKASAERGITIDRAIKAMVSEFPEAHEEFKAANVIKRDLSAATRV